NAVFFRKVQKLHCSRLWEYFCGIETDRHVPPLLHDLLPCPAERREGVDKILRRFRVAPALYLLVKRIRLRETVFFHVDPVHFRPDPHGVHKGAIHVKNSCFLSNHHSALTSSSVSSRYSPGERRSSSLRDPICRRFRYRTSFPTA